MESERWQRIQELFEAALALSPELRAAHVAAACAGDESLRQEVESLLAAHARAGQTLQQAIAQAARTLQPEVKELFAGQRLGPYEIVRELGRGGMGTVYLATRDDGVWCKQVAIKVVRGGLGSPGHRERFLHERRVLARLEHPYIARVLDGGETAEGLPWLAMEYIEGESLDRYCASQALRIAERLQLFERVCEAVHYAHRNLVIHRDLKPGNVLVQSDGTPRLLDFGIARLLDAELEAAAPLTMPGAALMSAPYASPEQVRGEVVTTASDICSLGVMLYELLVGKIPFAAHSSSSRALERAILEVDPKAPSLAVVENANLDAVLACQRSRELRGDLDAIVLKAMRKEPEARYESAAALADDLRRSREGLPIEARRGTWRYRSGRFVRRHRAGVAAALLVVLVLLGSAVTLAVQAARLAAERDRANEEAETSRQVSDFMVAIFENANPDKGKAEEITARELLDRGAQRIREGLRERPLVQARLRAAIGGAYRSLGFYDSAAVHLDEALALRERELGRNHTEYAQALHERAMLYLDRGELSAARRAYEEVARIRERTLGPDHPDLALTWLDLGIVYTRQDAPDSALVLLERASASLQKSRGPLHEDVAVALNSIAVVHLQAGRHDVADSLLQRVLTIREQEFGPDHPRVGELHNNLGTLASRRGDNVKAREHLMRAQGIFEAAMGPEHPQTISTMANLGVVLRRSGDLPAARRLQERCLELEERVLGPEHPNVAADCTNLARTLRDMEESEAAWALLQRAHAIHLRTQGPQSFAVARVEVDLAELSLERGERAQARNLAQRALNSLRALGRETDPAFERANKVLLAT